MLWQSGLLCHTGKSLHTVARILMAAEHVSPQRLQYAAENTPSHAFAMDSGVFSATVDTTLASDGSGQVAESIAEPH